MRRTLIYFACIGLCLQAQAQETLKISRKEAETIFLRNNLLLISESLHIESQKAEVIQSKLWPNPEFSISEINLWKTTGIEPSPPFWGNFGRDRQIAFELAQLVQTAGKRKKLTAIAQTDVAKAEQYFEDLLRGLKLELRIRLIELQYIQQSIRIHQQLADHIATLARGHKNQVDKGHIPKAEYIRLRAQELGINKEILALTQESSEIQKELRLLLGTDPAVLIEITDDIFVTDIIPHQILFIDQIIKDAQENRPDYRLALLDEEYSQQLLAYEKAQRIPDLTLGANYDRNGNTMLDFVGFGVSFDLPLSNRNKGNVRKAQINVENAKVQKEQTALSIGNEIVLAHQSLQHAIAFLQKIETDYETDLDTLLDRYTQNFIARHVSMLEYFDFMDAYLENKKIILEARKDVSQKTEELHYSLGRDF